MVKLEDELGDIIAKARIGHGCTVDRLANVSSLTARDIGEIESYRLKPDAEQLRALGSALELDPAKLADIAADNWEPEPPRRASEKALVETVEVPYGAYGENSYVLHCAATSAAAVVDPGGAVDKINKLLRDHGLTLDLVLITHAHADHIGGLRQLLRDWPQARLVSHTVERESVTRGAAAVWVPANDRVSIHMGNLSITPLATPGHTPGSTCYRADGTCFVGDTLFAGSIGRPADRLAYKQMLEAIKAKILSLPDDTLIFPGHGPATTVAQEKAHNPFF